MNLSAPRGGNLENPMQNPDRRRAPLNVDLDPTSGLPGLHRIDLAEFKDTAIPGLQKEQPWHRLAAYMILARRTNSEIAGAAGVTTQAISTLRGQRWFQELLATLANNDGEEIKASIKVEALASLQKIVEIRDNDEAPVRVQLAAAQILLEHSEGKPTQKILSVSATTTFSSEKDELEAIQSELRAIQQTSQT